MATITPTDEQISVVEAFRTGEGVTVEAAAGASKTTTLRMCAASEPQRRGLYVAFNRSIADEARGSFTPNVLAATAHSLAYRALGNRYQDRLSAPRVDAKASAEILGIKTFFGRISPYRSATIAQETVRRFCHSGDEQVLYGHVPFIPGLDDEQLDDYKQFVLPFARSVWEDAQSQFGRLRYDHDYYLKSYCLSRPMLEFDYILLDESQDLNPVLIGLMSHQDAQLVVVGDSQQSIYSWRGAVDAVNHFGTPHRRQLTMSFRFGQEIADAANVWLEELDATLRVRGCERESRVCVIEQPRMVLCRTNAELVGRAISAQAAGIKVAVVGGTEKIRKLALAALDLQTGNKTSHPDLFMFRTWSEVVSYCESEQRSELGELGVFVRLVTSYGAQAVIQACSQTVGEDYADVVLSTVHKFKGLEAKSVTLASDFLLSDADEERRLCYVAVTRAMYELDDRGLEVARQALCKRQEAQAAKLAREAART